MPSKTASKSTGSAARGHGSSSFVNDYLADWDQDDPFRSPSPEPAKNGNNDDGKKRDVLGIDKELDLKRKPRAPRVKLDETRLLSDKGIPKLRKTAQRLRFKGKGHEYNDAARLLSFYQEWLDDLFPKATFLDALAMVEKAGHKTTMRSARLQWIDETKPKPSAMAEDEEDFRIRQGSSAPRQPDKVAPIFETAAKAAQGPATSPAAGDLFGDEDIYNATPPRNPGGIAPSGQVADDDVPDDDDLDALMAEAEADPAMINTRPAAAAPGSGSIFGNGTRTVTKTPAGDPDDDDLDALMAEAETHPDSTRPSQPAPSGSIFGDGKSKQQTTQHGGDDADDLDALMAEAEADAPVSAQSSRTAGKAGNNGAKPANNRPDIDDGDDDLEALMAEAEAGVIAAPRPSNDAKAASSGHADAGGQMAGFEDDEEAMAEMDGPW
ncbi:Swi3-domain-containing protein [Parathielavia hyrcaniae]|uniref:Chromosome segregation in meiosis protein n=1 Tax=Parathielavia hyrcaniae TaxID=113614 RepID=A0AAN6Q2D2_9PEZI|nr:Swi3-domain-containing protein [Parathielavia hyrcaniae]